MPLEPRDAASLWDMLTTATKEIPALVSWLEEVVPPLPPDRDA